MPLDFVRFALPCVAALFAAGSAHAAEASSPEQALEAYAGWRVVAKTTAVQ